MARIHTPSKNSRGGNGNIHKASGSNVEQAVLSAQIQETVKHTIEKHLSKYNRWMQGYIADLLNTGVTKMIGEVQQLMNAKVQVLNAKINFLAQTVESLQKESGKESTLLKDLFAEEERVWEEKYSEVDDSKESVAKALTEVKKKE